MNRRDFLKGLIAAPLLLESLDAEAFDLKAAIRARIEQERGHFKTNTAEIVEPNYVIKNNNYVENKTNLVVDDIESIDGDIEFTKSINLVGKNEIAYFMDYFNIQNSKEFTLKVKSLQKLFGLKSDGIIGNKTLFMLYENYYIPNKENFDFSIKQHIENRENDLVWIKNIKFEMSKYPNKISNNGVKPNSWNFLRKIDKKIYGDGLSLNKAGTFIDETLYGNIPNLISTKMNIIYVENYYGKKILRVYREGKLEIACYVSPGKNTTKTPRYRKTLSGITDKYHASSNSEYRGAVMPYAVLVDGKIGIYLHGSSDLIDGKGRSHGCIRVPLFYQKKLYELVKSGINFNINTKNIYSYNNQNFDNITLNQDLY